MSFPRYPEYKDSGVEWLGEVPAHWTVAPLKHLVSLRSGGTPSKDRLEYWDGGLPWASAKDLKVTALHDTQDHITQFAVDSGVAELIPAGSVLIVVRGMILAKTFPVSIAAVPMAINQDLKALDCRAGIHSRFIARLLEAAAPESSRLTDEAGHGTKALRMETWTAMRLPVPPEQEQRAVVAFLDHETAKIDALIAEQEKLIELLKEKRQAVISHAVTKGLDPNVPMKDSGVEWLGEVPAHWDVKRLKFISPSITVGIVVNPSDYISDEGLPFIYGGDIEEGRIRFESARRIDEPSSARQPKTRLRAGDLLTVRVGAPGVTAIVPPECEGGNCASVMLVRRGSYTSEWLCYAMNSRYLRYQVEVVQYGAAQEQFNISHAINFWVPTPTIGEQAGIAAFLDSATATIDALTDHAGSAIDTLKERRAALISAAVTGQIDVRGTPATALKGAA